MRSLISIVITAFSLTGAANADDARYQNFSIAPATSRLPDQRKDGEMVSRPEPTHLLLIKKLFTRMDSPGVKRGEMRDRNPCLGKSLHIIDSWGC